MEADNPISIKHAIIMITVMALPPDIPPWGGTPLPGLANDPGLMALINHGPRGNRDPGSIYPHLVDPMLVGQEVKHSEELIQEDKDVSGINLNTHTYVEQRDTRRPGIPHHKARLRTGHLSPAWTSQ